MVMLGVLVLVLVVVVNAVLRFLIAVVVLLIIVCWDSTLHQSSSRGFVCEENLSV